MPKTITITAEYFRQYRKMLGFSNQAEAKDFLGAKDITPVVDFAYLGILNERLAKIIQKIDSVVFPSIRTGNLDEFRAEYIDKPFQMMKESGILSVLNNQGRRPEQVYYSWMRGYVVSNYFLKALGLIFEVDTSSIDLIGDDDFRSSETFKRTPKADLEVTVVTGEKIRIEVQCGFAGINDIKQHKVLEAKKVFRDLGLHSLAFHLDLYNGQAAIIKLGDINDDNINWITRQQMEGQTVFNIEQNCFVWKLTEAPIIYSQIDLTDI